jgi:hypothetical protein
MGQKISAVVPDYSEYAFDSAANAALEKPGRHSSN